MRTSPITEHAFYKNVAEAFAGGARLFLETVDCEVCGKRFVPHLITLGDVEFGLCDKHIGRARSVAIQLRTAAQAGHP